MTAAAQAVTAASIIAQVWVARELVQSALGAENLRPLIPWIAVSGALVATAGVARVYEAEQGRVLAEMVNRRAIGRILDTTSTVELTRFDDPAFHDVVQRAYAQAQWRTMQLISSLLGVIGAAVTAAGLFVMLAALQLLLLPVLALGYIPALLLARSNSDDSYRFSVEMAASDRQRSYLQQLMVSRESAKEIRALDLASFLRTRYERLYDDRMDQFTRLARRRTIRALRGSVVRAIGSGLTAGVLIWLYVSQRITLAALGAIALALVQLGSRLRGIHAGGASLYESSLYLRDYRALVSESESSSRSLFRTVHKRPFNGISVSGVTFTYPGARRPALRDISLSIEPGTTVALVGENGSGKTTLAKLLAALYQPETGQIVWNGMDTRSLDPAEIRSEVAVIFQDFQRYALSAGENIAVGRHDQAHDVYRIANAAAAAGADSLIEGLPDGYETLLGSEFWGGTDLSIGQWQRIALARAFFRDSPVVILDEPTSALDPRAEAALLANVATLLADRTVIIVSHRLSSVRFADTIHVLKGGALAETGTHSGLIEAGGAYSELFELQALVYGGSSRSEADTARGDELQESLV